MKSPVSDKNYVKVFILYLLRNIDMPLDFPTINDIALQDGYLGYFDFAECFAELLDDGHIAEIREDGASESKYMITEKGISVAESLSDDIFAEIRNRSLQSALRLLSFKERKAELKYACEEIPSECGGGYSVTCSVWEHGRATCSVTVKVDSLSRAEAIKKNFYERPEAIYRGTFALLTGDVNFIF